MSEVILDTSHHVSFKKIVKIAYPTIVSMLSLNIMQFVDRTFVAKYDITQFSAIMPSGVLAMTVSSIFLGIAGYVSVLVSQYYGARKYQRCGASMWQGVYLCIILSFILLVATPFMGKIFKLVGHSDSVVIHEQNYFYLMIISSVIQLFTNVFSGLFSGIGDTKTPMITALIANGLNIIFDWFLIFGKFGLPTLGIVGAGIATVLSGTISLFILILLLNKKRLILKYKVFKNKQLDFNIIKKLLRYGIPAGFQFFLGFGSFSLFILLIGKMGEVTLACTNIAFTIESVSFMPVLGLSIAVSILAGQERGAERLKNIPKVVKRGIIIALSYNILMIILFNIFPEHLISIFDNGKDAELFIEIKKLTIPLVRLSSIWLIFDSIQIIISSVLKSLGDTIFLLITTGIFPIFALVIPTYFVGIAAGLSLTFVWLIIVFFVITLSIIMSIRFLSGSWKKIAVI